MNIKQFLVANLNEKLHADVLGMIWENVKNESANKIASVYFYKVARNRDIFLRLLDMSDYCLMITGGYGTTEPQLYSLDEYWAWPENELEPQSPGDNWVIEIEDDTKILIAKYIQYIASRDQITYRYIQEPGAWITALRTIQEIFFVSNPPSWQPEFSFWVDLKYILGRVKEENDRFNETGVMWWDY